MFRLLLTRSIGKLSMSVKILALLAMASNDWGAQVAMAASPMLDLKLLSGQLIALARQPFGINVQLINSGEARQDARLRFFIHQEDVIDHLDVKASDIKVEILEGVSWVPVPVEPIDGSVMGAIGAAGTGHKEIHRHGGFAIPAHSNMLCQLRVTLNLPGAYLLVVAVSSNDGSTHFAQPSFITLEAL